MKPGNKSQMLGTHIGFELNSVIIIIDTHTNYIVLMITFNKIREIVLDCSYAYS